MNHKISLSTLGSFNVVPSFFLIFLIFTILNK